MIQISVQTFLLYMIKTEIDSRAEESYRAAFLGVNSFLNHNDYTRHELHLHQRREKKCLNVLAK